MPLCVAENAVNARGGTELTRDRMARYLPDELLDRVQVVFSRVRELDPDLPRVFYAFDLPDDPESRFLANGGWQRFNRLVFLSNWQMQAYVSRYRIPWRVCRVIRPAVEPLDVRVRDGTDRVRLVYHSTPHRGLEILVPVFKRLYDELGGRLTLDVYSSFKLYGWDERDSPYEALFDECRSHDGITYHGAVPNETLREALPKHDVFAFPSIWPETSCMCLIEAMSAGLRCVHSNLACLGETGAGLTDEYQYVEDRDGHAGAFYDALERVVRRLIDDPGYASPGPDDDLRVEYANRVHSVDRFVAEWTELLNAVVEEGPPRPAPTAYFSYRT